MSNCGDERDADADETPNPPDNAPTSEREDVTTAPVVTTAKPTVVPDKNSASSQILSPSPATDYPPASNNNININKGPNSNNTIPINDINSYNNYNAQSSEFMRQHGHYYQQQTPNSPAPPALGYDASQGMLLQHLGTAAMAGRQQFLGPPPPPLSPGTQNGAGNNHSITAGSSEIETQISLGVLAPSSPVYPAPSMGFPAEQQQQHVDSVRMTGGSLIAPASPSVQFMQGQPPSPVISGYGGVYGGYGTGSPGVGYGREVGNSPDTRLTWPERVQQQTLYQTAPPSANSPHIQSQPIPIQFPGRRTDSFDAEILPGPAINDIDTYTASTTMTAGGAIFSQQQAWGYNLTNPYTASPQQSQIQGHHPSQPPVAGGVRPMGGQHGRSSQAALGTAGYYPATTPGPPIQTTHHNKGPDGANLFIFHVPNHFTNLDMWHLFCHYGNLLSVRIMVEKDSGRSRGFGFVSYDSPDAAAMAIKELNGFVIGNKRLKVQHKQIRPSDNNNHQVSQHDHLQSPPLFPQMNIGHDAPTTGDAENESNGNIHMMTHNWLKDTHNGTGEMVQINHQSTVEVGTLVGAQGGQPQQSTAGEVAVVSEIDAQIIEGQSNNSGNLTRHYDDAEQNVGSTLSNLSQMRDALPDVTK